MSPPRLSRLVWPLALWAAAPAAAWAGGPTKVFPLAAARTMPAGLEGTPEKLTNVIAKLCDAKVEGTSINGAALAAGCSLDDSSCLDQIARAHRVKEIVFGSIRVGDDQRVFVKVTRFIAGTERRERTFVLTSETPGALSKQLAKVARGMFELPPLAGEEAPPEAEPEPARGRAGRKRPARAALEERAGEPAGERAGAGDDAAPRPRRSAALEDDDGGGAAEVIDAPADAPGRVRRGHVTRGTYFLIAGGALSMATGTGFAIAGYALRDDARRAQKDTPDDFQRLTAIERAGQVRTITGAVLLVTGGLAVAGGVVRAVLQRRPSDDDRAISLVPIDRGAAVVFSGRLP